MSALDSRFPLPGGEETITPMEGGTGRRYGPTHFIASAHANLTLCGRPRFGEGHVKCWTRLPGAMVDCPPCRAQLTEHQRLGWVPLLDSKLVDAKDEIAAARAERDEARLEAERLRSTVAALTAQREELERDRDHWRDSWSAVVAPARAQSGGCKSGPALERLAQEAARPAHYALDPEPLYVIERWGLGFHLGNVVKYAARCGRKAGASVLDDLRKLRDYAERAVRHVESGGEL